MLRSTHGHRSFPHDPALRGYQPLYHRGEVNRCPSCGRTHWYVGRLSAECGFCGTAMALAETATIGSGLFRSAHARPSDEDFELAA